jgi:hypothetical protein
MSTLIFIVSCFLLGLIVLSRIPGLEHLIKPVVGVLFKGLEAALSLLWAWVIYLFKTVLRSHVEIFKHLLLPAKSIDPSLKMREEAEKQQSGKS